MTQQERAQVAFKVLGVVLIVWALSYILQFWTVLAGPLRMLLAFGKVPDGALAGVASIAGSIVAYGLLGVVVIWAAPFLARRLLPPTDPPLPLPEETLRDGTCLIGGIWMSTALVMFLTVAIASMGPARGGGSVEGLTGGIVCGLVAVAALVFAFRPGKVSGVVSRLAGGPPQGAFAAGLCLAALWWGVRSLWGGLVALIQWLNTVGDLGLAEGVQRRWAFGWFVGSVGTLVLTVLLIRFSRQVAFRLAAARDGEEAPDAGVRMGGTAALALAVQVGAAYLFVGYLERLVRSPFFDWEGVEAVGALLHLLVVPALVGFGVFWLAGRIAWPVARRLHKPSGPDAEPASPRLRLLLEVALALLATHHAIGFLQSAIQRSYAIADGALRPEPLHLVPESALAGAAALVVLLLKGDLVRLAVRGGAGEEPDRATRVALLQPWLALLGVWLVLRDGPRLVSWAWELLARGGDEWSISAPAWGAVAGLVLIFGARWLAPKLSFGPLIRRSVPAPAET